VGSAGSRWSNGHPAALVTVTVASESGLDLSSRRAINDADLIVVAELDHLVAVFDKRQQAFAKTFLCWNWRRSRRSVT
jgi:hypothetical protein